MCNFFYFIFNIQEINVNPYSYIIILPWTFINKWYAETGKVCVRFAETEKCGG